MAKKKGKIVLTKKGLIGHVYNNEKVINGKVPVYLVNKDGERTGLQMMCDAETLTTKGYFD
jgi:hypothetical protein